jgi:hypothetical protein
MQQARDDRLVAFFRMRNPHRPRAGGISIPSRRRGVGSNRRQQHGVRKLVTHMEKSAYRSAHSVHQC